MCEQGSRWIDANLFNGEYYIQQIRGIPPDKIASGLHRGHGSKDTWHPEFQVGDGCFVDQFIGQHMATVAGLGDLLDPDHIRKAPHRSTATTTSAALCITPACSASMPSTTKLALVICDYAKGTRPEVPMPYYAEVWTGFEYSAAS